MKYVRVAPKGGDDTQGMWVPEWMLPPMTPRKAIDTEDFDEQYEEEVEELTERDEDFGMGRGW